MYNRPEVRLIEPQQVDTKSTEVTSSEAANLLAKYGYKTEFNNTIPNTQLDNPYHNMTIDDMFSIQQREVDAQRAREHQRRYGPKSITFDNNNVNYSNTEYRDLDVDGHNFGIQVQVVSDMPINNNRRI